ncbi:MAG: sulfite exporter TauE/SafE family protein [Pseudomonadota bacterium]|nr:sulfite exporter TauE/SafE family protein [Pseudomonadota bacterium]
MTAGAAEADYAFALIAGLMGSGHCVGMCGALVSAFFIKSGNGHGALPYAAYHGARISVYSVVGVLAAALGAALVSTGLIGATQGVLQIIAGLAVILLGLDILGVIRLNLSFCGLSTAGVRKWFLNATRRGPVIGSLMAGTLNGFMPCALTFAMAIKATTLENPLEGGLLLFVFGLGTLPSMLFVSVAFGKLGSRVRGWLLKGAAIVVILMGASTMYQGVRFFDIMRGLAW